MDKASEAILTLKPVTFRYKRKLTRIKFHSSGLIAEEVEKVDPDLSLAMRAESLHRALRSRERHAPQRVPERLEVRAGSKIAKRSVIAHQQKQIEALTATVLNERSNRADQINKSVAQLK